MIVLLLNFLLSGCDKAGDVGLNVQPAADLLNVIWTDTVTIRTALIKEDTIRTDQGEVQNGLVMLGKYIDPVFGTTEAAFCTKLSLPSQILVNSFGASPICDSVVLSLDFYGTYYGETSGRRPTTQRVNVYQMSEDIASTTHYYSNQIPAHYGIDLAVGHSFYPQLGDSVNAEGKNQKAQLRIPLQKMFGQMLLNNQGIGVTDNSTFEQFIKGLYITAGNTAGLNTMEGRINTFRGATSTLNLYYENTIRNYNNTADSVVYSKYYINAGPNRYSVFNHNNYTGCTQITQQLADTLTQWDVNYLQCMGGLKTRIRFPYLKNIVNNGPIAVNKAELVIKVDQSAVVFNNNPLPPPPSAYLFGIGSDGLSYFLPDYGLQPFYYNSGYEALSASEYRLNISRYIQQVLDGKRDNSGLYFTVSNLTGATYASRAVIGSGCATAGGNRMKLEITFTKLH